MLTSALRALVSMTLHSLVSNVNCSFCHVKREGNKLAHALAHRAVVSVDFLSPHEIATMLTKASAKIDFFIMLLSFVFLKQLMYKKQSTICSAQKLKFP